MQIDTIGGGRVCQTKGRRGAA